MCENFQVEVTRTETRQKAAIFKGIEIGDIDPLTSSYTMYIDPPPDLKPTNPTYQTAFEKRFTNNLAALLDQYGTRLEDQVAERMYEEDIANRSTPRSAPRSAARAQGIARFKAKVSGQVKYTLVERSFRLEYSPDMTSDIITELRVTYKVRRSREDLPEPPAPSYMFAFTGEVRTRTRKDGKKKAEFLTARKPSMLRLVPAPSHRGAHRCACPRLRGQKAPLGVDSKWMGAVISDSDHVFDPATCIGHPPRSTGEEAAIERGRKRRVAAKSRTHDLDRRPPDAATAERFDGIVGACQEAMRARGHQPGSVAICVRPCHRAALDGAPIQCPRPEYYCALSGKKHDSCILSGKAGWPCQEVVLGAPRAPRVPPFASPPAAGTHNPYAPLGSISEEDGGLLGGGGRERVPLYGGYGWGWDGEPLFDRPPKPLGGGDDGYVEVGRKGRAKPVGSHPGNSSRNRGDGGVGGARGGASAGRGNGARSTAPPPPMPPPRRASPPAPPSAEARALVEMDPEADVAASQAESRRVLAVVRREKLREAPLTREEAEAAQQAGRWVYFIESATEAAKTGLRRGQVTFTDHTHCTMKMEGHMDGRPWYLHHSRLRPCSKQHTGARPSGAPAAANGEAAAAAAPAAAAAAAAAAAPAAAAATAAEQQPQPQQPQPEDDIAMEPASGASRRSGASASAASAGSKRTRAEVAAAAAAAAAASRGDKSRAAGRRASAALEDAAPTAEELDQYAQAAGFDEDDDDLCDYDEESHGALPTHALLGGPSTSQGEPSSTRAVDGGEKADNTKRSKKAAE